MEIAVSAAKLENTTFGFIPSLGVFLSFWWIEIKIGV